MAVITEYVKLVDNSGNIVDSTHPVPTSMPSGGLVDLGAKADAAVTDPTALASAIAALKGLLTDLGILTSSAVVDPTASANINALLKGIMTDIGPVAATAVADPAASASVIAALKGLLTDLGPVTASAVADPTASAGVVAALKGILTQIGILTSAAVTDPSASGNINSLTRGILTLIGALTASAVTDATASGSSNALLKGLLKQLQGTGPNLSLVDLGTALSSEYDSIDVSKMSKGTVTTAHSAITGTATSNEIDCRGFNTISVEMACSAFSSGNWNAAIHGCAITGGTFGACFSPQDAGTHVAMTTGALSVNGNYTFFFKGIPNFVKVVATRTTDGTLTCKCTPMNL